MVFPDGTKHQFMYPTNRTIEYGEQLQVDMSDGNTHVLKIIDIMKTVAMTKTNKVEGNVRILDMTTIPRFKLSAAL